MKFPENLAALQKLKERTVEKISNTSFTVFGFSCGPVSTNAYLVICNETKKAAIIDPSPGSFDEIAPIIEKEKAQLTKLIYTHSHWDHISDGRKFFDTYNPEVLCHPEDKKNVENPGSDNLRHWLSIDPVTVSTMIIDGDTIQIGNSKWTILHTPGHSPGGICLFSEKERFLFSGDTLFKGTIGRLDLPTSEPEKIFSSLEKLSCLPKETIVLSGHGPETTIGNESWLEEPKKYIHL